MLERSVAVTRTARYYLLGSDVSQPAELWVVLHGYAQLANRFLRQFRPLEDGATVIAAPEALSRFYLETGTDGRHGDSIGASWLTREHRESDLDDHHAYLDRLISDLMGRSATPPRLTLLGFSQGAAMAARWVLRASVVPERLVLWGSPLPKDIAPAALAAARSGRSVCLTAGDHDPYVPLGTIEANARALREHGARAVARRFTGGHAIPPGALLNTAEREA